MFSPPPPAPLEHGVRSRLGTTRQKHDNDQTREDTSGRTWPPISVLLFKTRLNGPAEQCVQSDFPNREMRVREGPDRDGDRPTSFAEISQTGMS